MSIRNVSYGLTREEYKWLCLECQKPTFDKQDLLFECAKESNREIAEIICESILYGMSYDRLSCMYYIPINKNDFYAYRRKCIALFAERIRL